MHVEHLAARYNDQTEKFEVAMEVTRDDGTSFLQLHVFPPETLEWRAAEYGIDPEDTDTLLDIVLNEPFAEGESPLWTAPDRDQARAMLLEEVRERKARLTPPQGRGGPVKSRADKLRDAGVPQEYVDAADQEEPLGFLKRAARVNPQVVEAMAKHVDGIREAKSKRTEEKVVKGAMAARVAKPMPVPEENPLRILEVRNRLSLGREQQR